MFGFLPDAASVAMDDALDQGLPDARALEFILTVQALEDAKELVRIFGIEPDAIVLYVICVFRPVGADTDFNAGRLPAPGEFDRVGEKVDKDLAEEDTIPPRLRNRVPSTSVARFAFPSRYCPDNPFV